MMQCRRVGRGLVPQKTAPILRSRLRTAAALKVPPEALLEVASKAADLGAEVVLAAATKPKRVSLKEGFDDVVTETDAAAEAAIVDHLTRSFPGHAILGEEGGVRGGDAAASEYLWCIDPLDGTVNFSTGYRSFCVSVGVLRHATPVAAAVIEFLPVPDSSGGAPGYVTRKFTAARNAGAFLNGRRLQVSATKQLQDALVATELSYYETQWHGMLGLVTAFTKQARGVRCSGAAAANLCHLAEGVLDAYYQYNLKPWDVAAGALIVEEAGGRITTADGTAWSVFDKSLLATNDAVYGDVLAVTEPATVAMRSAGAAIGKWFVPAGYRVRSGAQL